VVEAR